MKKDDFITLLAEELETTKKDATWIYEGFSNTVFNAVTKGLGDVTIEGVAKLKVANVPEREHRVPSTGEKIVKPAHKKLKLTVLKKTKDVLENK